MSKLAKEIIILNDSFLGYLVAVALKANFGDEYLNIKIINIENSSRKIDLGFECFDPSFGAFHALLGIKSRDLVENCLASPCLGTIVSGEIEAKRIDFVQSFGETGLSMNGVGFQHYWKFCRSHGLDFKFDDFNICSQMARNSRFTAPSNDPNSVLSSFSFGLNVDLQKYASLLERRVQSMNIDLHNVQGVSFEKDEMGNVNSVEFATNNQESVFKCDLLIDCRHTSKIIEQGLNHIETLIVGEISNFQISNISNTANRIEFKSDGFATQCRTSNLEFKFAQIEKMFECYNSINSVNLWDANHINLALTKGAIMPISGLYMRHIQYLITQLLAHFPRQSDKVENIRTQFNRKCALNLQSNLDITILFALLINGIEIGDLHPNLLRRIMQFLDRGRIVTYDEDAMSANEWMNLLIGLNHIPKKYDPRLSENMKAEIFAKMNNMKGIIQRQVQAVPKYQI